METLFLLYFQILVVFMTLSTGQEYKVNKMQLWNANAPQQQIQNSLDLDPWIGLATWIIYILVWISA